MSSPNRRARVTGASSGIGRAIATELAADGVDLVVVARSTDRLSALADELDVEVEVMTADLLDDTDVRRVDERLGVDPAIDLLVNNAGFGNGGRFDRLDLDRELAQVQIHIRVMMQLTHAALTAMRARGGGGGILNVSSMGGFQPMPGSATYMACKAYETSFSESIRLENAGSGIHVTALCPGFVDTPMVQRDAAARRLPRQLLLSPEGVARAGIDGVAENKAVVVPGVGWKAAAALSGAMPRSATRLLLAGVGRLGRSGS